jgi:hypothetical protein
LTDDLRDCCAASAAHNTAKAIDWDVVNMTIMKERGGWQARDMKKLKKLLQ